MIGQEETSPTRQAWLDGLKKGDAAVMRFTPRRDSSTFEYYAVTVDLVSDRSDERRLIYAGGYVYSREGKWYETRLLVEPTAEALNEVERTRLVDCLVELNWRRLSVAVLNKIIGVIEADSWTAEIVERKRLENDSR